MRASPQVLRVDYKQVQTLVVKNLFSHVRLDIWNQTYSRLHLQLWLRRPNSQNTCTGALAWPIRDTAKPKLSQPLEFLEHIFVPVISDQSVSPDHSTWNREKFLPSSLSGQPFLDPETLVSAPLWRQHGRGQQVQKAVRWVWWVEVFVYAAGRWDCCSSHFQAHFSIRSIGNTIRSDPFIGFLKCFSHKL